VNIEHEPTPYEFTHGEWMPNPDCGCPDCEAWFAGDEATWD
jgi:hypothetical protein